MNRTMNRARAVLVAALVSSGCARAPTQTSAPEPVTLEQLHLAERYGEVVLLAASVIEGEGESRARVAEARFFRALAWLAQDPHANQARALLELRTLEFEYSDQIWGQLAAVHVAAATRIDALQATLLELVSEQRELQVRIDALTQRSTELAAELVARDGVVAKLERERSELLVLLEQTRAEAAATAVRLRELELELAALKQIDMQREP
jgi:hypothetical protein